MQRRDFLRAGLVAASGTLSSRNSTACPVDRPAPRGRFKLNYAPHFGMFKHVAGSGFVDQIQFAADQGFTAWEDRALKARPVALQRSVGRALSSSGIQMGAFEATAALRDLESGRSADDIQQRALRDIRECVAVAKRTGAKWLTAVLPNCREGDSRWEPRWLRRCTELLARCCEIVDPHELVLVLEPAPGCAISSAERARQLCRAVGSPACKLLFDLCQPQNARQDLQSRMDQAWPEIGYFHCRDNPGAAKSAACAIGYRRIFRYLYTRGFSGIVGMEHGNAQPGRAGDLMVIETYLDADRF